MAIVKLPHKQRERIKQLREGHDMCVTSCVAGKGVALNRGTVLGQHLFQPLQQPR